MRVVTRKMVWLGVALAAATGLTACGSGSGSGSKDEKVVAFMMPQNTSYRVENIDKPTFEAKVAEQCPDCKVNYYNAKGDSNTQTQQLDAALTNGADVIVLMATNSDTSGALVKKANDAEVPVIAYDNTARGDVALYTSMDNVKVGELQAESLLSGIVEAKACGPGQGIVRINGDPSSDGARQFKRGADPVVKKYDIPVLGEYFIKNWDNNLSLQQMDQALTRFGKGKVCGVLAQADGLALGVVQAMKTAGLAKPYFVSGQDGDVAVLQKIIAGEMYMTIFKDVRLEANGAAQAAVDILDGKKPQSNSVANNGTKDVPAMLYEAGAVTKDNILDTIVAAKYVTVDQICTADYAAACAKVGLK